MSREPQDTNEAAGGMSDSTAVLDAPTCAIGGVFVFGTRMAACDKHGGENRCFFDKECEHKRVANAPELTTAPKASGLNDLLGTGPERKDDG